MLNISNYFTLICSIWTRSLHNKAKWNQHSWEGRLSCTMTKLGGRLWNCFLQRCGVASMFWQMPLLGSVSRLTKSCLDLFWSLILTVHEWQLLFLRISTVTDWDCLSVGSRMAIIKAVKDLRKAEWTLVLSKRVKPPPMHGFLGCTWWNLTASPEEKTWPDRHSRAGRRQQKLSRHHVALWNKCTRIVSVNVAKASVSNICVLHGDSCFQSV